MAAALSDVDGVVSRSGGLPVRWQPEANAIAIMLLVNESRVIVVACLCALGIVLMHFGPCRAFYRRWKAAMLGLIPYKFLRRN